MRLCTEFSVVAWVCGVKFRKFYAQRYADKNGKFSSMSKFYENSLCKAYLFD